MPEDRGLPKLAPQQMQELTAAIERGDVIVCLTKCEECQAGSHYDEPTWHGWAGAEDIEHARATGQPDPSNSRCGCYCSKTEAHRGPVSDSARTIVLDYLQAHGWKREDQGPVGELWVRGDAVTVVPTRLEPGSWSWMTLATALSQAHNEPVKGLLAGWRNQLAHSSPSRRTIPGRVELEGPDD